MAAVIHPTEPEVVVVAAPTATQAAVPTAPAGATNATAVSTISSVRAHPEHPVEAAPVKMPKRKLPYNSSRRKNPDWEADEVIHLFLKAVNDQKVLNRNNAQAWEDVRVQLHKTPLFRGKRISANSLQRRLAAVMASTQKRQSLRLAKEACGIEEVAAPWHGLAEALYAERQRCRKNKQSARVTPTRKEVLDEFAQRLTRAVFSQIRTSPEVEVADVKAQAVQELKAEYPEVDVEEIVRQHTETLLKRRAAADNAVAAAGSAAVSAALGAAVAIPTGGLEGHGMTVPLLTGGKRKHDDLDAGQKRRRRFLGTGVDELSTKLAETLATVQSLSNDTKAQQERIQRTLDELPGRIAAAVTDSLAPLLQK